MPGCHNYISLCPGTVAQLGWPSEPGHVAAPVPHWIPWHKVRGSTITGPHGQLERGTPPASCMVSPPGTPGCAVRAQGHNCSPRNAVLLLGEALGYPGAQESPGYFGTASGQKTSPSRRIPSPHLPCQAAASPACTTELWALSRRGLGHSPLAWLQDRAGSTPACTWTGWAAGSGPIAPCPAMDRAPLPQPAPNHSQAAGWGCCPPCRPQNCPWCPGCRQGQWAGGSVCSKEMPALRQAAGKLSPTEGAQMATVVADGSHLVLHYQQHGTHRPSFKGDFLG